MTSLAVAVTAGGTDVVAGGTARTSGGNCMTAVGIPIGGCSVGKEGIVGLLAAPNGEDARGSPVVAAAGTLYKL